MLQETKDEEPIINQPTILKPVETPPTILQPIQKEAPLLNEEEDQITNPQEQVIIPHYKNYDFILKLSDYTQSELENKFAEITNEQLKINKLLNEQLSNIGLAIPSSGITHQFLKKHQDVLSDDLIDLISYSDDLQAEEKRIEKKILELEKHHHQDEQKTHHKSEIQISHHILKIKLWHVC